MVPKNLQRLQMQSVHDLLQSVSAQYLSVLYLPVLPSLPTVIGRGTRRRRGSGPGNMP